MNETLESLLNDNRISEIVICDDVSKDIADLETLISTLDCSKIKLYKNAINLGCYHNKIEAVSKCTNEWAILLDSDNIIGTDFIDILFGIDIWNKQYIYTSSNAVTFPGLISPSLNFSAFSDMIINKDVFLQKFNNINFICMINDCNYFLPVRQYYECMIDLSKQYDRQVIDSQDSALLFADWLSAKNFVFVVKDLTYKHRCHSLSNYMTSQSKQYEPLVKQHILNKVMNISYE
jgi:glycosyltransferase involved in cell wall biosynthesis